MLPCPHSPSSKLKSWLPDRKASSTALWCSFACAIAWFALYAVEPGFSVAQPLSFFIFAYGALLLGIAYGCMMAAVMLVGTAVLQVKSADGERWMSLPQAARVALTLLAVHSIAIGLLALAGMWKPEWPWFFGILPFLWR
jgi:hypothetical protein